MNTISWPFHLLIPALITLLILRVIVYRKKQFLGDEHRRLCWISLIVFSAIYGLIFCGAAYASINAQLTLHAFDLNGDGLFSEFEQTVEQRQAMKNVTNDVGRNFAVITGLIIASIIASAVFILGKLAAYWHKKTSTNQQD